MTDTAVSAPAGRATARRHWGIRHRIVLVYLGLLIAALLVSLVATRQALLARLDRQIDDALAQEIDEVRQLAADGINPETGQPFGGDVAALLNTFMRRNVPADNEAFYSFLGGSVSYSSFNAPAEPRDDPALLASWSSPSEPVFGNADTAAGHIRYLAVPLLVDGAPAGAFVVVHFPASDRAEVDDVIRIAALAGAVVLVIAAAVAWSAAGRVIRPIRELTETAHGITETDLSGRIPVTGNDELSDLGATFNAMIERLERGFAGQRQFLDDVAHELRTPITIVQGHLELMGDDPDDRAETLAIVRDELDRMNRYVNDLLLLAKSETTEFLRPEPIDLGELAASVQSKLQPIASRRWTVDAAPAPGSLAIVADPGRLTQALLNLATNAVQHTAPGDLIAFGIEPTGTGARLWVRDTGSGLEPGLAERLFDRRIRGAASRVDRADGLGLGLSIVAAIVRAHGGTIAASNDPTGGARFTISLPFEPPAGGATAGTSHPTSADHQHREESIP